MGSFPSLYRARAVDTNGRKVTAFVPSVFGEQPITIIDSINALPSDPGMGWVFFQAGNPEFPVWVGVASGSGDGEDGEDGADGPPGPTGPPGPDEIFVGPEDPIGTYPLTDLWYDTDAIGLTGQAPYGLEAARPVAPGLPMRYFATDTKRDWLYDGTQWVRTGVIASHSLSSTFTSTGVQVMQDEGLTVTIDEPVGRLLKVTISVNPYAPGGPNACRYQIVRNGVAQREWTIINLALGGAMATTLVWLVTGVAGTGVVWKVMMAPVGNNTAVASYGPAPYTRQLLVEDVGPA